MKNKDSYATIHIKHHRNMILFMVFWPIFVIIIVAGVMYAGNRGGAGAEPPAPPNGQQWQLIFSDEFNDTSLDLTKWQPNWFGSNNTMATKPVNGAELSCYDPSQLSEGGGSLTFTVATRSCSTPHGTYNYASGLISSYGKFSFTYGYLEARMWLPPGNGPINNWPAFWANGTGTWPVTGELDVMEGLNGRACYHFHNTSGGPGGCANLSNPSGWHTFGAKWEAGAVTYYYDGQQVGKLTSGITSAPMYLIANLGVSTSIAPPIVSPSSMKVDYIRVYKLGAAIPSPTPTPTPPAPTPPPPAPAPTPPAPQPAPAPTSPTEPEDGTTPEPVVVPGANPDSPVKIPENVAIKKDGTLVADFTGDGLNEVVQDTNNDGQIDPGTEIVVEGKDYAANFTPSKDYPLSVDSTNPRSTVTIKPGPLPEVRIAKPVVYTFLIVQSVAIIGLGTYFSITRFAIFGGLRGKLGL